MTDTRNIPAGDARTRSLDAVASGSRSSALRQGGRKALRRTLGPLVLLALWSAVTYTGIVDSSYLPTPTQLIERVWTLATEGYRGQPLIVHIGSSLIRTMTGFVLACIVGIPFGLLLGMSRALDDLVTPILSFFRPIPPIAFIPLAIIYLGLGEPPKIALVFYASFIYIIINAQAGVRTVPEIFLRAGRTMGLSQWTIFRRIILPGALPSVMAGVRVAVAVSWGVVVAAELIAAQAGLGFMVASAANLFDLPTVYAGIVIIGLIGATLDLIVQLVQGRVLHWQGKSS